MKKKISGSGCAFLVFQTVYGLLSWGAAIICVLTGVLDQAGFLAAVCAWGLTAAVLCIVYFHSKLLALQNQVEQLEQKISSDRNDESAA